MSRNKPLIGITADGGKHIDEEGAPAYLLRRNYADAIIAAGGLPLILPYDCVQAADNIDAIDGLLISGGHFDLPPSWYGSARKPGVVKEERRRAERALVHEALACNLPLLGVCNGMQLLAVLLGGKLVEHIPTDVGREVNHMAPQSPETPQHALHIEPQSITGRLAAGQTVCVNSLHHQSVREGFGDFQVTARASDGVVDHAILAAFVQAARGYRGFTA